MATPRAPELAPDDAIDYERLLWDQEYCDQIIARQPPTDITAEERFWIAETKRYVARIGRRDTLRFARRHHRVRATLPSPSHHRCESRVREHRSSPSRRSCARSGDSGDDGPGEPAPHRHHGHREVVA